MATDLEKIVILNEIQAEIHDTAVEKGWWDEERQPGTIIALIHSELSEALEWIRSTGSVSDHIAPFTGLEEELADAIIRILDWAEHDQLDVAGALLAKLEYNKGREYRHGGKKY